MKKFFLPLLSMILFTIGASAKEAQVNILHTSILELNMNELSAVSKFDRTKYLDLPSTWVRVFFQIDEKLVKGGQVTQLGKNGTLSYGQEIIPTNDIGKYNAEYLIKSEEGKLLIFADFQIYGDPNEIELDKLASTLKSSNSKILFRYIGPNKIN